MNRARIYDFLFLASVAVGAYVALVGCEAVQNAGEVAVTPSPELGGKAPVEVLVENGPKLIAEPYNPENWVKVVSAVVAIGGGLFAGKKLNDKRKAKKAKKAATIA